jgi:hypothetical protein
MEIERRRTCRHKNNPALAVDTHPRPMIRPARVFPRILRPRVVSKLPRPRNRMERPPHRPRAHIIGRHPSRSNARRKSTRPPSPNDPTSRPVRASNAYRKYREVTRIRQSSPAPQYVTPRFRVFRGAPSRASGSNVHRQSAILNTLRPTPILRPPAIPRRPHPLCLCRPRQRHQNRNKHESHYTASATR